jgi:asparagine synthase (glutamine-hydrolysing)
MKSYLRNLAGKATHREKKTGTRYSFESRVRAGDLASSLNMDVMTISLPALLRYEDKNSMFHGLEARVPFLDRKFFDYAASLPLNHKLRNGITKYVFRLAMSGILPEKVLTRRDKIGFEIPEKQWIEQLRDRLKSFFEGDLLANDYYDLKALMRLLDKPLSSDNEARKVWRILNLEVWYREFFGDLKRS